MKKLLGLTAIIIAILLPAIVHAQITSTSADQLVLMFQYSTTCGDKPVPFTFLYDKVSMTMTPVKNNCMKSEMFPNFNNDHTLLVYTESDANDTYGDISVYNIASKTIAHLPLTDFANYPTNDIAAYFDNNGKLIFNGDGTLKKMDVDGTNITTITTPEPPYHFTMFWMSPNREKIITTESNQQGEDYHTSNYQRLVLMNSDGTGRTLIGQEYLGDWNLLAWKEDSNSFFYYHHIFNMVGGVYQGQIPKYDLVNLYGGSANIIDLSNSYLGKEDGNVCLFTKSGNLLSLSAQELYNGQTGALIAHRADVPTWTTAMFGFDSNGDIYFANLDGSNFRQFEESAQGPQGNPKISVSPMSVNLGSVKAGGTSNPKTVTIKNTGNGDLIINSITISGTNQSEFIQTNNCSIVPAKSSCPITVTSNPSLPFGKKSAIMSISSNDPKKSTINVRLSGQAPPPSISASPGSVNFGKIKVGSASSTKTIKIKNTGKGDLSINSMDISGTNLAEFSQSNDCITIPNGGSCAVNVVFTPTLPFGNKIAAISISSNDPKKSTINVKLSGTGPSDLTAPSVPQNLVATPVSSSEINLSWNASTDNVAVTGYKVYKNGVYLKEVAGTSTSDTGLTPSTPYCYTVSARDAANNQSAQGSQACATTQAGGVDTQAPSVPTGLTATAASSSQINLSWNASTDNVAVTGYKVYKNGVYLKEESGTSTSDTGLTPSTPYCYTVSARDAANNQSAQGSQACATTQAGGVDTQAPSVPTGLTATAASSSQINLSWNASTDNVAVTGYKIYKNGVYLKSTGTRGTTSSDTGLSANTLYCYTASAFDAANNESGQSAQACATTQAGTTTTGILRLVNNTHYDFVSILIDNVEQLSSTSVVRIGNHIDYALSPGQHNYQVTVGPSKLVPYFYQWDQINITAGNTTEVVIDNVTVVQVLTNFKSSTVFKAGYWLNCEDNYAPDYGVITIKSDGTWISSVEDGYGNLKTSLNLLPPNSGTVQEVNWADYATSFTFRLNPTCVGCYDHITWNINLPTGFYYNNGPGCGSGNWLFNYLPSN